MSSRAYPGGTNFVNEAGQFDLGSFVEYEKNNRSRIQAEAQSRQISLNSQLDAGRISREQWQSGMSEVNQVLDRVSPAERRVQSINATARELDFRASRGYAPSDDLLRRANDLGLDHPAVRSNPPGTTTATIPASRPTVPREFFNPPPTSVPNVGAVNSSVNSTIGRVERGLARGIPRTAGRALGIAGLGLQVAAQAGRANELVRGSNSYQELAQNIGRTIFDDFVETQRQSGNALVNVASNLATSLPLLAPVFPRQLQCSLFGRNCDRTAPDGTPISGNDRQPAPPFYGGQSPTAWYEVYVYNKGNPAGNAFVGGRIVGVLSPNPNSIVLRHSNGNSDLQLAGGIGAGTLVADWSFQVVRRLDGLPDTDGNPAPLPGAPSRPPIAPIMGGNSLRQNRTASPSLNAPSSTPEISRPPVNHQQSHAPNGETIVNPTPTNQISPSLHGTPATPNVNPSPNVGERVSEGSGSTTHRAVTGQSWAIGGDMGYFPNPQSVLQTAATVAAASTLVRPLSPTARPSVPGLSQNPSPPGLGSLARTGSQSTPSTPTAPTTPSSPTCFYDSKNIKGGVDQANITMNAVQLFMQNEMMTKLNTIDTKLGDQIPNGGLSGFVKNLWNSRILDRILNILTFVTVLHNAQMLSSSIVQTLFSAFDNVLNIADLKLKDAEGNETDTSSWVGDQFKSFFTGIFGAQTVEAVSNAWKKWNRIYQSVVNMTDAVRSMIYSVLESIEQVGKYVARIGNAHQRAGNFLETEVVSFAEPEYGQHPAFKRLYQIQELVETLEVITSEIVSIQENLNQFNESRTEFQTEVSTLEAEVKAGFVTAKEESKSPDITEEDENPN